MLIDAPWVVRLNKGKETLSGNEKTPRIGLDGVQHSLSAIGHGGEEFVEVHHSNCKTAIGVDFQFTEAIVESAHVAAVIAGKAKYAFYIFVKRVFSAPISGIKTSDLVMVFLQPFAVLLQNVLAVIQRNGAILEQLVIQTIPNIYRISKTCQRSALTR